MNRILLLSMFIVLSVSLRAAQYVTMDPTAVLSVTLSSSNHNRIGIVGDRIKKAFFRSNNVFVSVEEDSGQLFVQAIKPNCPKTTLSIVTVSGSVQDLELTFNECSSEIVLLQPVPGCEEEADEGNPPRTAIGEADLADLVEGVLKGIIPEGYASFEDLDQPVNICKGLTIQRLSRLVNDRQIIFVYKLQNCSKKAKSVTECQVNVLDGDWVFLDWYQLKPMKTASF